MDNSSNRAQELPVQPKFFDYQINIDEYPDLFAQRVIDMLTPEKLANFNYRLVLSMDLALMKKKTSQITAFLCNDLRLDIKTALQIALYLEDSGVEANQELLTNPEYVLTQLDTPFLLALEADLIDEKTAEVTKGYRYVVNPQVLEAAHANFATRFKNRKGEVRDIENEIQALRDDPSKNGMDPDLATLAQIYALSEAQSKARVRAGKIILVPVGYEQDVVDEISKDVSEAEKLTNESMEIAQATHVEVNIKSGEIKYINEENAQGAFRAMLGQVSEDYSRDILKKLKRSNTKLPDTVILKYPNNIRDALPTFKRAAFFEFKAYQLKAAAIKQAMGEITTGLKDSFDMDVVVALSHEGSEYFVQEMLADVGEDASEKIYNAGAESDQLFLPLLYVLAASNVDATKKNEQQVLGALGMSDQMWGKHLIRTLIYLKHIYTLNVRLHPDVAIDDINKKAQAVFAFLDSIDFFDKVVAGAKEAPLLASLGSELIKSVQNLCDDEPTRLVIARQLRSLFNTPMVANSIISSLRNDPSLSLVFKGENADKKAREIFEAMKSSLKNEQEMRRTLLDPFIAGLVVEACLFRI